MQRSRFLSRSGHAIILIASIASLLAALLGVPAARGQEPARYSQTVPSTSMSFEMVRIPGGSFTMGSPESEPGRKPDEGPQFRVRMDDG